MGLGLLLSAVATGIVVRDPPPGQHGWFGRTSDVATTTPGPSSAPSLGRNARNAYTTVSDEFRH
jgi:hypothetical protein